MPIVRSMPEHAGPPYIFQSYPDLYRHWSEMSQDLMNGPSPLSPGERELILAFAAGTANCRFVYVAHCEVAYAWGIERGVIDLLIKDVASAPVASKLKPLLSFVRKLIVSPQQLSASDADDVFAAGWEEKALHDAIAIAARAAFMQRLVEGFGFIPLTEDVAREHAAKRVRLGYVNMYGAFAKPRA